MKPRATAIARRGRWALSFADLSLLLLGFFVLLNASASRQQDIVGGVAREFGGTVGTASRLVASDLFQPGEALLSASGKTEIARLARGVRSGTVLEIRSVGIDGGASRFDGWDLAAARLGAVARGLVAAGVPRDRLVIRGLDQDSVSKAGQVLVIRTRPR